MTGEATALRASSKLRLGLGKSSVTAVRHQSHYRQGRRSPACACADALRCGD
jgi:hypothetical protein